MQKRLKILCSVRNSLKNNGFTLVEVMIAGVILGSIMIGVAQMSGRAMVGGNNQKNRQAIEAAISNDIQLLQQADSQITRGWIEENGDINVACENPGEYLAMIFNDAGGEYYARPNNTDPSTQGQLFERTIAGRELLTADVDEPKMLAQVVYTFEGPEQSVEQEQRIIELSPSFQAHCY